MDMKMETPFAMRRSLRINWERSVQVESSGLGIQIVLNALSLGIGLMASIPTRPSR